MLSNLMKKLFNDKYGKIIVSIILGLGIASLFKKTCVGEGCVIIKSVSPEIIQKNTYRYDDKCYKYKAYDSKCDDDDKKNIEVK